MYILIVSFGAINIYSANNTLDNHFIFDFKMEYGKQFIWIIISAAVVGLVLLTDYKFFNFSAYGIYIVIIIMLLVLLATGTFNKGAQAWFKIGSFKLQPSEFAKYATALALAKFLGAFDIKFEGKKNISIALGIIFFPMLLTLAQNDTGSALVFVSFVIVLFREGLSGWWLVLGFYLVLIFVLTILYPSVYILIGILLIVSILIYFTRKNKSLIWMSVFVFFVSAIYILSLDYLFIKVLKPHQQQRILVTLNQDVDEFYENKTSAISFFKIEKPNSPSKSKSKRDYSYNVRQSKISIGAGRWFGNGFNNGTQTKAKLVPEQHTDFIFCTVGEEYGFVGSSIFIILYLFFIGRIFFLAERQKNAFSRIFGYSTASILFFHFFINIGMAMGYFQLLVFLCLL
jgi:rod shape determining protein RodA